MVWWLIIGLAWGCEVAPECARDEHEGGALHVAVNVLADDQGEKPLLDHSSAFAQLSLLNRYFECADLKFDFTFATIKSNMLMSQPVLLSCLLSSVGDGKCQPECNVSATNFDGGDCLPPSSMSEDCAQSVSVCREACNMAQFNWDHGTCCEEEVSSLHCRDPRSPKRVYIDVPTFKQAVPASPSAWNIYIVNVTACSGSPMSLSTPAWRVSADALQGTILDVAAFSPGNLLLVHELGHILGLPNLLAGDLLCSHPCASVAAIKCTETEARDCANQSWGSRSLFNVMGQGYSFGTDCIAPDSAFSPKQCSQMRCHLTTTYPSWLSSASQQALGEPPFYDSDESDETEETAPVGPLGIVGVAIGAAILIGGGIGMWHAMRTEAPSREALETRRSTVSPTETDYVPM